MESFWSFDDLSITRRNEDGDDYDVIAHFPAVEICETSAQYITKRKLSREETRRFHRIKVLQAWQALLTRYSKTQ